MLVRLHTITPSRRYNWLAKCDCGSEHVVDVCSLGSGATQSCGCLQRELLAERLRTHGQCGAINKSSEYITWTRMKSRCLNKSNKDYLSCGGRGITICDSWLASFTNFFADMGPRPTNRHSIDRIDNDGPYAPENCRWATNYTQSRNTSRNKFVVVNGERMIFADAAARFGFDGKKARTKVSHGEYSSHQHAVDEILKEASKSRTSCS